MPDTAIGTFRWTVSTTIPQMTKVAWQLKEKDIEALTPGRQRGYVCHFAAAKQSATRAARIEKAMPAIFEGRGFLERR